MICDTPQVKIPEPVIVTGKGGTEIRIDIVEDLAEFTSLSSGIVEELIIQSRNLKDRCYNARSEFSDCMARQNSDHWFYLGSRYFIFENAKHATDIEQSIKTLLPEGGRIWEFGGGCGNISMSLAAQGYDVTFSELSSLQKDFLRFRAHRHGLKIRILDSWEKPPLDEFDLVLAIDVLEHIPEYKEILEQLCDSVKTGGIVFETSAFEKDSTNVTHHIPDKYDYRKIMSQHGLNLIYGVSVGRLWKKPAGLDRVAGSEPRQMQTGQTNDFQWFFGRGLEEVAHGDYTLALDYFQDAWEVNPAGFESIFKSEISKLKAEQFELLAKTAAQCLNESKQNLNHAAKLICGPLEAPKYVKAGMSQLKAGNLSGALENFNKASELDGTIPNVHYTLAVLLSKQGRYGAAKTSCLEQLRYEPQHSQAKEMIDKLDMAIAEFQSMNVEKQR